MESKDQSPPPPAAAQTAKAAGTVAGLHVPALIGVTVLAAVLGGRAWVKKSSRETAAHVQEVHQEVDRRAAAWGNYRTRFEGVRWRADRIHAAAAAETTEPMRSWARERARLFDAFVAQLEHPREEQAFAVISRKVDELVTQGHTAQAQALATELPIAVFPQPEEVLALQRTLYLGPLVALSRQNPQTYKAFLQHEPEAAKEDIAVLRAQLDAAATSEVITSQEIVGIGLLSAVLPEGDPALADWAALASAEDYFEDPDGPTLAQWRQAQKSIRLADWPNAVAHMQSILRTTIRTRQRFRAAYGWALIKNRPDQPGEARPFLQEAANAGDPDARRWVANNDLAEGRFAQALRGFEIGVAEGDPAPIAPLLKLYAMSPDVAPRDDAREGGVLQKIIAGPDAPPEAALLLGQLHEYGRGFPVSARKGFELYEAAARKPCVPAWVELARCYQRGIGTSADAEQAFQWASRAYAAGEREKSVPLMLELMQSAPDRISNAVQEMFDHESVAVGGGYTEKRIEGPSIAQLKMSLAKYLDQKGRLGQAARYYGQAGSSDPAVARRFAELTASHPCEACGGAGKISDTVACPTCGGKGDLTCGHCDGHGTILVPGAPPCTACAGNRTIVQNGRLVTCPTCEGTGKGKDSVTKKDCTYCVRGRIPCAACVQGRMKILKECQDCKGKGTRSLSDQDD